MRIAYLINSLEGGGAALPLPDIVRALRAAGATVRVLALTLRDGRALPPLAEDGVDVAVRPGGTTDHLAAWAWLEREVAAFRPDLLWTSLTRATLLGQLVGRRRRLPVVSWQHAAWLRPANLRLLRRTHRWSGLWLADSETVAAYCRDAIGVAPATLAVWPIFRADPSVPLAAPGGSPVRIGSLGRLHPVKGYDLLLHALGRLPAGPAWTLAIAGEGGERATLAQSAAAGGLAGVALPGFVANPARWLAELDLYVQPSRSEGFCIAAHQAMQAGLPVIGSAVGEMGRSVVPGATGWLIPPGDVEALAAAFREALADPARLAAYGAAGRARVLDRFGPAAFAAAGAAVMARVAALVSSAAAPRR